MPADDPTKVLGRRVLAYIIDFSIAGALLVGLFLATAESFDKEAAGVSGITVCDAVRESSNASVCFETDDSALTLTGGAAAAVFLMPLGVSFANLVLLQGTTGASAGKSVVGLRVVNDQGAIAGVGRAFVRWLLLIVDGICGVLGLVVAALTTPHRRVGDFVAGTYVVGKTDAGRPVVVPAGASVGVGAPYSASSSSSSSPPPPPPPPPPQGFGAPGAPPPPTTPTEAPTTEVPTSGAPAIGTSAPQWDAQRSSWVAFDATRNAWLRFDGATQQWRPLD
jgi:uncharacterized RDD family membrane protein YckC